jgi:hypothetical protein
MHNLGRTVIAALILLLLLVIPCSADNVLLWKKSGVADFENPDPGSGPDRVQCEFGLQQALIQNGHTCTVVEELPEDLRPYEMIFITLGMAFLEEG